MRFHRLGQRFCLTAADVVTWLGFATAVALRPNDLRAGRERQLVEFFFDGGVGGAVDIDLHQCGAFAAFRPLKQNAPPA